MNDDLRRNDNMEMNGPYGSPEDIFDFIQEHRRNFIGKRLLLVEDKEENREIVCRILQNQGFIVDIVKDCMGLIEKLRSAGSGASPAYAAVLMGDRMSEADGIKSAVHIPVIKLSKPIDIPIMLATLVQCV